MMGLIQSLKPSQPPRHLRGSDELAILKERILQSFLIIIVGISILLSVLIIPAFIQNGRYLVVWLFAAFVLFLITLTVSRQLHYTLRAYAIVTLFFLMATGAVYLNGLEGGGPVIMAGVFFLATLLLGPRQGFISSGLAIVTMIAIGYLYAHNLYIPPPLEYQTSAEIFREWIIRSITLSAMAILFVFALMTLVGGLNQLLVSQKKLAGELKQERDTLEERVRQRTLALEKRASEIEAASHIARDISTINDLDALLNSAVNLLKDEFGFYYAAVFLTDERKEYAVLHAGTGEAGQVMLAQHHRHPLEQTSMVGYAISRKEVRLSQNVSADTVHYRNPLLPDTRSEIAIPLIVAGEAIGALDVQSTQADFFQPDDIRALRVAVDQLAVAFEKARLVQELTHTLEDLKNSYRQVTEQTWQNFLKATRRTYDYRMRKGVLEFGNLTTSLETRALATGNTIVTSSQAGDKPKTTIAIPIKLRDQVLGVLDLQFDLGMVSDQTVELLEATANRLALALENARLLEEIQIRASRERLVSDISAKVRAEADVERVLQTVAVELGHSMGVSGVLVQLRGPE